jgi:DNA/RNA-binding domain of Phe-tRNA-synthetase-like protein
MIAFHYHPDILGAFPQIVAGVIFGQELDNHPTPPALLTAYQEQQDNTRLHIGDTPMPDLPSVQAWRSAFRSFGVKPTQYRSAIEALLRRLMKHGDIPSINTLVDIANLVSIRYTMPVAVFDTRSLELPVCVQFSDGTEHFTTLHQTESVHPDPGEVIFSDQVKTVIARRWCWRQSAGSASRADTQSALITVEALHPDARADVESALEDLHSLLHEHSGGKLISGILDQQHPELEI